jgi:hypothetical protein
MHYLLISGPSSYDYEKVERRIHSISNRSSDGNWSGCIERDRQSSRDKSQDERGTCDGSFGVWKLKASSNNSDPARSCSYSSSSDAWQVSMQDRLWYAQISSFLVLDPFHMDGISFHYASELIWIVSSYIMRKYIIGSPGAGWGRVVEAIRTDEHIWRKDHRHIGTHTYMKTEVKKVYSTSIMRPALVRSHSCVVWVRSTVCSCSLLLLAWIHVIHTRHADYSLSLWWCLSNTHLWSGRP